MSILPTATNQQKEIVSSIKAGNNVFVQAGAGAAKSTTIYMAIQKHMKESLYLVFNAANRKEATEKFKEIGIDWAEAHTWHSLAYKYVVRGSSWAKKGAIQFFWDYSVIQNYLNSYAVDRDQVYIIVELIKGFCQSDYSDIKSYVSKNIEEELYDQVLEYENWVEIVWNILSDKHSGAKITPDIYLKVFLLKKPDLSQDYKVIYLDEGQDTNPVCLQAFYAQKCQKIVVGDTFQAIYAWRGAINAFANIPENFVKLKLTESFRFGQDIADLANICLKTMGADFEIIGRGTKNQSKQEAIIVRNNITMFEVLLEAHSQGKKVYAIADLKDMFAQMYTASAMLFSYGNDVTDYGKFPHKQLLQYKNWGALVADQSLESKKVVSLVKKFKVHECVQKIKSILVDSEPEADLVVVTGHKSKGLQFGNVTLMDDFLPNQQTTEEGDFEDWDISVERFISEQGMNLLYVALTRAQVSVKMSLKMESFLSSL